MLVPSVSRWDTKLPATVPVNDGGYLTVMIRIVSRCHSPTTKRDEAGPPGHTQQVGLTS